jgi:hypothetical protein
LHPTSTCRVNCPGSLSISEDILEEKPPFFDRIVEEKPLTLERLVEETPPNLDGIVEE